MIVLESRERLEHIPLGGSVGVIYLAIGARFIAEARVSAESVRRALPGVPIALFTDRVPEIHDGFNAIIQLSAPHPRAHINKLVAMMQSPFEKTLLLDTDTYVCADISDLFAILERFDIALTHERPYRDDFPASSGVPDAFVEFNQGVIAFRRSYKVQDALKESLSWAEKLDARYDQPPFGWRILRAKFV